MRKRPNVRKRPPRKDSKAKSCCKLLSKLKPEELDDPRLRNAWMEWEMSPPGRVLELKSDQQSGKQWFEAAERKRPSYEDLTRKYYGDIRLTEFVRKAIEQLHRHPMERRSKRREYNVIDLEEIKWLRSVVATEQKLEPRRGLNEYDVRHWFAADPAACIASAAAQRILRAQRHPFRPWVRFPSQQEINAARTRAEKREIEELQGVAGSHLVERQHVSWWEDLRGELIKVGVADALAHRFADYLSGYMLVRDQEQQRGTPEWRRAKRLFSRMGWKPGPTVNPPHRESLKTTVTRLMVEHLQEQGAPQGKAAYMVTSVWELIGKGDPESDPASTARVARLSRRRKALTK
ncbi:MAG TPA: hypothetical protein VIH17_09110 [Candidatus Acidoferrales bacterium]